MEEENMMSLEELMEILDNMKGLSEEEREDLMNSLSQQNKPGVPAPLPEPPFTHQAMVLTVMLTLVAFLFVFFGYKLIKSIKEKERKKEEKKKQKQSKKKK